MPDIADRIKALTPEQRKMLEERLAADRASTRMAAQRSSSSEDARKTAAQAFDVVVLGGGLASQTLAMQVKKARPETSILVVEKRKHPAPEAAFKVGESSVEAGAYYFRGVLGLEQHMIKDQLLKAGIRFFFPHGKNDDIAQRPELGGTEIPPVNSYQIDRGRFENMLLMRNRASGVEVWDNARVTQVDIGELLHSVGIAGEDGEQTVSARWVVDASGRSSLLKRKFQLAKSVNHIVNASWFRIDDPVDLHEWSNDRRWGSRVAPGLRRLSTNHLMGRGYWVWLIPLASGATSFGIVAEARLHPFETINTMERSLAWLRRYEPQVASVVESRLDRLQDFHALKHYAYGCTQVYSGDRWCLTGEAGTFADPLYSPGSDMIGLSNTYVTDLIIRDLSGESIRERAAAYDKLYLNAFEALLTAYEGLYPSMGNAQVMTAKIVWDFLLYWAFIANLFFQDKQCDLEFMASVANEVTRANYLNARVQALFRDWDLLEQIEYAPAFVDFFELDFLHRLHLDLAVRLDNAALKLQLVENLKLLETVATEIFRKAASSVARIDSSTPINPYGIGLDQRYWEADELFLQSAACKPDPAIAAQVQKMWLCPETSTAQAVAGEQRFDRTFAAG